MKELSNSLRQFRATETNILNVTTMVTLEVTFSQKKKKTPIKSCNCF